MTDLRERVASVEKSVGACLDLIVLPGGVKTRFSQACRCQRVVDTVDGHHAIEAFIALSRAMIRELITMRAQSGCAVWASLGGCVTKGAVMHDIRRIFVVVAIWGLLLLSACGGGYGSTGASTANDFPMTIENCGRSVTIEEEPTKIVTSNTARCTTSRLWADSTRSWP